MSRPHQGFATVSHQHSVTLGAGSDPSPTASLSGIGGAADINSMNGVSCGNITIAGGSVTATGGSYSAGIGSGNGACGTITIDGGTVVATGGQNAAGIGSGYKGSCSMVMIRDCINSVNSIRNFNYNYFCWILHLSENI